MCVLVAWLQQIPGHPVVVAANRDERFSRPSTSPFLWPAESNTPGAPRLVAPRDDIAGGTWWAVSEAGLFVGITNRAGSPTNPSRRSRGLLVLDLAREPSLDAAERRLRALDPGAHNGFHVLVATGEGAVRAVNDGHRIDCVRLRPGLHVISERSFGALQPSRDDEVLSVFQALPTDRLHAVDITRALGTHHADPWRSVCVHPGFPDYGTRSSSLLAFSEDGRHDVLLHADGPPCVTPLVDRSDLLRSLRRA